MDPHDYWKALRKSWIVIVALTIVGGLVGVGYTATLPDSYRAQTSLFVASSTNSSGSDLSQGSTFAQNVVQSYAGLATTSAVLTPVIAELNLDTTPTRLARQITAQTPLNTVFVNISVTDPSAQNATNIANAVARSLRTVATDLAPTSSSGRSPIAISIVAPALVPQNPASPNRHLIQLTAALIGFALGILYSIGRLLFDTRLQSAADIESASDIPVVGAVRRGPHGRVALRDDPEGAQAEDFRRIGATLRFTGNGRPVRSITLTSTSHSEQGSELALDLALATAERSLRVLVIDADLRAPSLDHFAAGHAGLGLTDVLGGAASLTAAAHAWADGVDLLVAGSGQSNPHFALGSTAMAQLVLTATSEYDFVVVQTASVLDFADALTLSHLTDGTLVAVRSQTTNRRQLHQGLAALDGVKASVIGLVLTEARLDGRRGSGPSSPRPRTRTTSVDPAAVAGR